MESLLRAPGAAQLWAGLRLHQTGHCIVSHCVQAYRPPHFTEELMPLSRACLPQGPQGALSQLSKSCSHTFGF